METAEPTSPFLNGSSMLRDAPGRKRKATARACGSRDRGLLWYSTYALDCGYEALSHQKKPQAQDCP